MKNKKFLIIILPLILLIGIGITYAYYKINFNPVNNVFVASSINTSFNTEYISSLCTLEDRKEEYNFSIKNVSDKPFMVRVSLDEEWIDVDNNVVGNNIVNGNKFAVILFDNPSLWKKIGNYYYYKNVVENSTATENLIKGFEVTGYYDGNNICSYNTSTNIGSCTTTEFQCESLKYKLKLNVEVMLVTEYEDAWNVDENVIKSNSTYTVNFHSNAVDVTGTMTSVDFVYGTSSNLPTNLFEREGYGFVEWNTDYRGLGKSYKDGEEILDIGNGDTDIVNLYAIWAPSYDVEFESNDSTNCPLDSTLYIDIPDIMYGNLVKQTAIPNPDCTGYTFNGWIAEGDINSNTAKYGILNVPQNSWVNGNKGTYFKNLSTTGGTVTLIATWKANTYQVKFNGNGVSSGGTKSISCTYNEDCKLSYNGFKKTDYIFKGWSKTPSGDVEYRNGEVVKNLTNEDEIILYAVWERDLASCPKNHNIEISSGTVCKRAERLHDVSCTQGTMGCKSVSKDSSKIIYGNCGLDSNTYTTGDAFDCDVNGDGTFDSETERFYYVSDYYDPNTNDWDSSVAVLVYYTNVKNENNTVTSDTSNGYAYHSSGENLNGPLNETGYAMKNLPTTTQWGNVTLKNTSRQIRNQTGGTKSVSSNLGTIDYTGYAARFLTTQELAKNCNISIGSAKTGELDTCSYIMENTSYQNGGLVGGIWFETANGGKITQNFRTLGGSRKVDLATVSLSGKNYGGTRPTIEVAKSKISIDVNDISSNYTITFNGNGATSGSMDVLTCETYMNCILTKNTFEKEGYVFAGWSTTINGLSEYDNEEAVYNLVTSGNANLYAVWDDTLYSVVKYSYDKNTVDKYVGHNSGNFENDVYYYKGSADSNNVIFGGFCFLIVRTTETGGIKLLYNGVPSNGTCLDTRGLVSGVEGLKPTIINLDGNFKYGDSFTIVDNNFVIGGNVKSGVYGENTELYQGLYTCLNIDGTCSKIYHVGSNYDINKAYVLPYIIGDINHNEIATSSYNADYKSISSLGYMYNESKDYGDNGLCYFENEEVKRCLDSENLLDDLNNMLSSNNVNKYNSAVKSLVETWFENNMLDYSNDIEDTIYCNKRDVYNLDTQGVIAASGWNGGSLNQPLYFNTSTNSGQGGNLLCSNNNDKFTVSNTIGNGMLKYPVGLLSFDEYYLMNYNSNFPLSATDNGFYLMSPNNIADSINNNYASSSLSSGFTSVDSVKGVRPVISLKPGTMYITGSGSSNSPYIVVDNNNSKSTLVIDLDGGESTQKTIISVLNGEEIELVTPVKEDYKFMGWTLKSGTPSSFAGNSITLDGSNVVIKANWKRYDNLYSVNFTSSDNINCPLDSNIYSTISNISYDSLVNSLALANPVCSGYTFAGWTATGDINLLTAKYGNINTPSTKWTDKNKGTYFKNLSTIDNGVVNLIATWTRQVLYDVFKDNYDNNQIIKYTRSGSENYANDVYYYSGDVSNNNVILGGICFKMFRTTDTGGVKMIYNGYAVDGKCESTRGSINGVVLSDTKHKNLSGEYLYGTRFTYENGIFSVSGDLKRGTFTKENYENFLGLYTCRNETGKCDVISHVDGYVDFESNKDQDYAQVSNYSIGEIAYSEIGKSSYSGSNRSPAMVGYMYNKSYNFKNDDINENSVYGEDVTYSDGLYTLTGVQNTKDSSHHYSCNSESTSCSMVRFYYRDEYYIELSNGENIEDALNNMLVVDVNRYDSSIKSLIDNWYYSNMTDYTNILEDTVYCNNRTLNNYETSGWSKTGSLSENLKFNSLSSLSLDCINNNDKFTVSNTIGNGKLTYPVGLITNDEVRLIYNNESSLLSSSNESYSLTPISFYANASGVHTVLADGSSGSGGTLASRGVRPVISVNGNITYNVGGVGTVTNPYVIDDTYRLILDLDGGVSEQEGLVNGIIKSNSPLITLLTPTKKYAVFEEFEVIAGTVNSFDNNVVTLNSNSLATIKAKYRPIKYNVSFSSSDNTNCPLDSTIFKNISNVSYDTLVNNEALANPSCSGYSFKGWTIQGDYDLETAKYGSINTPSTNWMDKNKGTYFKNLSSIDNGNVTLIANFSKETLYDVFEDNYDNNQIIKYTRSGSENYANVVYYYSGDVANNNVILGGICFKMFRTTDTGGVKMIYNGYAVDGKCESTRGNVNGVVLSDTFEKNLSGEYLYGTRFTYENGIFSVSGTLKSGTFTKENYENFLGLYTCGNETGKCDVISHVDGYVDLGPNKNKDYAFVSNYSMGEIAYSEIGKSSYSGSNKSPAMVGYMFNKSYNFKNDDINENSVYGEDVTYSDGLYTLTGVQSTKDSSHHYSCNSESTSCTTVRFYYRDEYYIELLNGEKIEDALNNMLNVDVNRYDSSIKSLIDNWYYSNMTDYTNILEDTVYCNNRTLNNYETSGWSKTGSLSENLKFNSLSSLSLDCINNNDKFTVSNTIGNGKLTYPVGLITNDEVRLLYNNESSLLSSSNESYSLTPISFYANASGVHTVLADGSSGSGGTLASRGVRPVISVKSSTTYRVGTNGTEANPYVIEY